MVTAEAKRLGQAAIVQASIRGFPAAHQVFLESWRLSKLGGRGIWMHGFLTLLLVAAFALCPAPTLHAQPPSKRSSEKKADDSPATLRNYADGPLTAADFQGTPPAAAPVKDNITMVANTMSVVRYTYRLRTNSERDGSWTAQLIHFDCFSAIEPAKCWNAVPESPRVLDHEQGHFDLAEIFARRLQRRFDDLMAGKNASWRGRTDRAAREALEKEIKKVADDAYAALAEAQAAYDKETRHGTRPRAQREHRRSQRQALDDRNETGRRV
jgi:hypothetical protein